MGLEFVASGIKKEEGNITHYASLALESVVCFWSAALVETLSDASTGVSGLIYPL